LEGEGFGGNMGEDVKRVSRDDAREARDYSNAVSGVGSLKERCVIRGQ
jgi:hypothetical protein